MDTAILPGRQAPDIALPVVGERNPRQLGGEPPERYRLIVVYRGQHCPLCQKQLETIADSLEMFRDRKIEVIAVSCDDHEKAEQSCKEWDIEGVPLAYGLPIEEAQRWGLYVSTAIKDAEPHLFSEPGMFLINREGEIQAIWIQSVPFARPRIEDVLDAVDFIEKESYPPRGTVRDTVRLRDSA